MKIRIIDRVTSKNGYVNEILDISGVDTEGNNVSFLLYLNSGGSYEDDHALAFCNGLTDENLEIIAGERIVSDNTYLTEEEYFACGWRADIDKRVCSEFWLKKCKSQSWNQKRMRFED